MASSSDTRTEIVGLRVGLVVTCTEGKEQNWQLDRADIGVVDVSSTK